MEKVIVLAGTRSAGKTAAINAVSGVVSHLAGPWDLHPQAPRRARPDALDHGIARLADGWRAHLYGAPVRGWPDFVYDLLAEMAHGLVILVDSRRSDPRADLETWLDRFSDALGQGAPAVAVGITHGDACARPRLRDSLYRRLDAMNATPGIPVFEVDGRSRSDIAQLLLAVSSMVDQEESATAITQIRSGTVRQSGGRFF
jgi:signal recognition particle receptor subunit beta